MQHRRSIGALTKPGPGLEPSDPGLCRAAILTLAELEDFHSVPRLIELLEEPGIGDNALWALRKLSGSEWGPSVPWWQLWYQTEVEWYRNGYRQAQRRLAHARQGSAAEALREYSEHRLFRHTLAADIEAVLERPEPPLRLLACETLGTLGSRRSIPVLVDLLGGRDTALREAAHSALEAVTGAAIPEDADGRIDLAALLPAGG